MYLIDGEKIIITRHIQSPNVTVEIIGYDITKTYILHLKNDLNGELLTRM